MNYNINFMNMLKLLLIIIGIFLIIRILNVKNNKITEGFDTTINDAFKLDIDHLKGQLNLNDNRQNYLDGVTNIINMAQLNKLKTLIDFQKTESGLTKDNFSEVMENNIRPKLMQHDQFIESLKKTEEYINNSE